MKKNMLYLLVFVATLFSTNLLNAQTFNPNAARQKDSLQTKSVEENSIKTTASSAPKVEKNFESKNLSEKEYDNSNRKVLSFKIVNGEAIIDEDEKRSILIYYDDYQVHKSLDAMVRCSIRVYVLNDMTEKVSNLGIKIKWPELSTSLQMNQLNPGVRTYKDIMLLGQGCFSLDKTPTIEVNRCRIKGKSQSDCADAIKWFDNKKKN